VPPGTGKGHLFVHDPKVYHTQECQGRVELMVRDGRGNKITVTRSITVTQNLQKLTLKINEATIDFQRYNGTDKSSVNSRLVDVTKEMCKYMGVTKAIISNVVLCHQEDSNWPLDEAKKLKEKFDAIFGTTEFNKAIKRIKQIMEQRKDYTKKHDGLKMTLTLREYEKAEAEKKTMELRTNEETLKALKTCSEQSKQQMEPLRERLLQITQDEKKISKMDGRRVALTTQ
jgi:DNA repair protein RAD50